MMPQELATPNNECFEHELRQRDEYLWEEYRHYHYYLEELDMAQHLAETNLDEEAKLLREIALEIQIVEQKRQLLKRILFCEVSPITQKMDLYLRLSRVEPGASDATDIIRTVHRQLRRLKLRALEVPISLLEAALAQYQQLCAA